MHTEQLLHFAVSDDTIQCHVTCTKYFLAKGEVTYRVSFSSQFPSLPLVPLTVEKYNDSGEALHAAARIRGTLRDMVLKAM